MLVLVGQAHLYVALFKAPQLVLGGYWAFLKQAAEAEVPKPAWPGGYSDFSTFCFIGGDGIDVFSYIRLVNSRNFDFWKRRVIYVYACIGNLEDISVGRVFFLFPGLYLDDTWRQTGIRGQDCIRYNRHPEVSFRPTRALCRIVFMQLPHAWDGML